MKKEISIAQTCCYVYFLSQNKRKKAILFNSTTLRRVCQKTSRFLFLSNLSFSFMPFLRVCFLFHFIFYFYLSSNHFFLNSTLANFSNSLSPVTKIYPFFNEKIYPTASKNEIFCFLFVCLNLTASIRILLLT